MRLIVGSWCAAVHDGIILTSISNSFHGVEEAEAIACTLSKREINNVARNLQELTCPQIYRLVTCVPIDRVCLTAHAGRTVKLAV